MTIDPTGVTGFVILVFAGSFVAGIVGALAGLGGGVVLVPLLTVGFGLDVRYAIGASIVSVIATSSGAAAAYVRDRITNLRIGMFLELATTTGAISGALAAAFVQPRILFIVFGIALALSVLPLLRELGEELPGGVRDDALAARLRLAGSYPDATLGRTVAYGVTRVPLGLVLMWLAGLLSGLLGIGSGTLKVLAMDVGMRLPMKVSTTTSNLMIGVTAAASAGIYFSRGDVLPVVAAPVALGVLAGAGVGTRLLVRMHSATLRKIFVPLLLAIAIEMLLRGFGA